MMSFDNITIFAAFLAGVFSFISPCTLPLVPVYLGYLSGATIGGDKPPSRRLILSHALTFIGGFTFVFVVVFGLPAGYFGGFLGTFTRYLVWVGGLFLIIFGLHTIGVIMIPILNREKRLEYGHGQAPGYVRSVIIGMTFAAGWVPCIGPLLGMIITLALQGQNIGLSMFYLFVYSMGLAIPFLISAWMLTTAAGPLKKLNQHMQLVERVSGAFIILIGVLLVTGSFAILNGYFSTFAPEWLLEYI